MHAPNSPFLPEAARRGKLSALFEKRGFQTRIWLLNNNSRKGNRNFPQRTPIWQRFALREEGEFAPLHSMCAPKRAQRAEKPLSSRQYVGEQWCRP